MIVCCCARRCTGETGTPFEGCSTWAEYITACVAKLDEEPKHRGRPVLIVAHSHGTIAGYSVARRLGLRVSKLCAARPLIYARCHIQPAFFSSLTKWRVATARHPFPT